MRNKIFAGRPETAARRFFSGFCFVRAKHMLKHMKLSELAAGESAEILAVPPERPLAERLKMLNVAAGKQIKVLRFAPFGDGVMLEAEGVRLALRGSLAAKIAVIKREPKGGGV